MCVLFNVSTTINIYIFLYIFFNIFIFFPTNIGSPQGDGISALFFIIYLAISLSKYNKNTEPASGCEDHTYSKGAEHKILPTGLEDHNYYLLNSNQHFTLDQQYADDIGWASTQSSIIDHIEKEVPILLDNRNLKINASKTERYNISRKSTDDWKSCKYIGSLLGTQEDIDRRKQLTNFAYQSLKTIFSSKHITDNKKIRIFSALIESIFLYNSELWGTTKLMDDKIDKFQRKIIRLIFGINWKRGNWLSNEELYKKYKLQLWSKIIAHRRLLFFGHVARLDDNAPAKIALREAIREVKKNKGKTANYFI